MRRRLVLPEGRGEKQTRAEGSARQETEEKEIAVQEFELLMREIPRYF